MPTVYQDTVVIKNIHGYTFMEFHSGGGSRCQTNEHIITKCRYSKSLWESRTMWLWYISAVADCPTFLPSIFFLIYLFWAALGLCCCTRAFSSCGEQGYSSFWCVGFSLRCLLLLRSMALGARASVVVACGLSSCGTQALECSIPSFWQQFPLGNHTFPTPYDMSITLSLLPKRWTNNKD